MISINKYYPFLCIFILFIGCTTAPNSNNNTESGILNSNQMQKNLDQAHLFGTWKFYDYEIIEAKTDVNQSIRELILNSTLKIYQNGRYSLKMGKSNISKIISGVWDLDGNELVLVDEQGNKSIWIIEKLDEYRFVFTSEDATTHARFKCISSK